MAARRRRKKTSRARRAGRSVARGVRGTAINVGAGALAAYGMNLLTEKVQAVARRWWAGPAVLGVGGHLLARRPGRMQPVGYALCGAAGFAGFQNYKMSKMLQPAALPAAEAGMLTYPTAEAGMLMGAGSGYAELPLDTAPAVDLGAGATIGKRAR